MPNSFFYAIISYFELRDLLLRGQLALELMDQRKQFSTEDVIRLKFGTRMLVAERVLPDLLTTLRNVERPSAETRSGLSAAEGWGQQLSAHSRGVVLFERFWNTYRRTVSQPFAVPWSADDPFVTPRGLADQATAVSHLEEAV